jgi:hypothetical protein
MTESGNYTTVHAREMARFLRDLRDLVLRETAAQRQQIHAQWQKPLAARVADGYAIENVRLVEVRRRDRLELACGRNRSRFRPGDILCLSHNDPFNPYAVMVNLEEDDETRLVISCEQIVPWKQLFATECTLDIGFVDLSDYVIGALAELAILWLGGSAFCRC